MTIDEVLKNRKDVFAEITRHFETKAKYGLEDTLYLKMKEEHDFVNACLRDCKDRIKETHETAKRVIR